MNNLQIQKFNQINLNDDFFISLKSDYQEFSDWFNKKHNSTAFTFYSKEGAIDGFLYLKIERESLEHINAILTSAIRIKIGTFKINPHGTRLGERFIKRAFDIAIFNNIRQLYVTIFPKHVGLIDLFLKHGFILIGTKESHNGVENVYIKDFDNLSKNVSLDYPMIPVSRNRHFVLSLYPKWHSRLLPDSLLSNESTSIIEDVSHTNSIHKIYLTNMSSTQQLIPGDTLLIYRTACNGAAYHTSVITSIGVVENVLNINSFTLESEFLKYCLPYSIFTKDELISFYRTKSYPFIIKFTYNLALKKRVNRKLLLEDVGIPSSIYWGFFNISTEQFKRILELSTDYEKSYSIFYTP